jgi:hypothetical protein
VKRPPRAKFPQKRKESFGKPAFAPKREPSKKEHSNSSSFFSLQERLLNGAAFVFWFNFTILGETTEKRTVAANERQYGKKCCKSGSKAGLLLFLACAVPRCDIMTIE